MAFSTVKKYLVLVVSLVIFCLLYNIFPEQKAVTQEGRFVILNDDGTWKYVEFSKEEKAPGIVSDSSPGETNKNLTPVNQAEESPKVEEPKPIKSQERLSGETTPSGQQIYTGPRGGRYHYSKSGKKVYEKRRK